MFKATGKPQPSTSGSLSDVRLGRNVGEENVDQIVTIEVEDVTLPGEVSQN